MKGNFFWNLTLIVEITKVDNFVVICTCISNINLDNLADKTGLILNQSTRIRRSKMYVRKQYMVVCYFYEDQAYEKKIISKINFVHGSFRLTFSSSSIIFLFIFYLTRFILQNFPSKSSKASFPFLSFCLRTTTALYMI